MSFRIDETTNMIRITRGDTGQFKIDLMNIDGSIYELKTGDLVQFTVKKSSAEIGGIYSIDYFYDIELTSNVCPW